MSWPTRTLACMLAAAFLLPGLAALAADDPAESTRTKEGLDAFRAYLKKEYPDKKWQCGPARLDNPAVRAAYGRQRFCYVYSEHPVPPGAVDPDYPRRFAEFTKMYLSLTARVDEGGKVTPLARAEDYDAGLMKVRSDDDARTAAAAILSLGVGLWVQPGALDPKEVTVTRGDKGWECLVDRQNDFQGRVALDTGGRCTAVSKMSTRPFPP